MDHSLSRNGYHAGYIKDLFGCIKRPCECAGFEIKDKTIIGMDCCYASHSLWLKNFDLDVFEKCTSVLTGVDCISEK